MEVAEAKERLLAERASLESLSAASRAARGPVELDQQSAGRLSRMDAMQVQAMALEAERRRRVQIQRIDAALRRIEEGEYGCCINCGEEIAPGRLAIDPAVALCTGCAR